MAVSVMGEDKKKALNLAIAQIEKNCGKGSIMKMGSETRVCESTRFQPVRSTSTRRSVWVEFRVGE